MGEIVDGSAGEEKLSTNREGRWAMNSGPDLY
jgi:hypothetical protein